MTQAVCCLAANTCQILCEVCHDDYSDLYHRELYRRDYRSKGEYHDNYGLGATPGWRPRWIHLKNMPVEADHVYDIKHGHPGCMTVSLDAAGCLQKPIKKACATVSSLLLTALILALQPAN